MRLKGSPFIRDLLGTTLTSVGTIVSGVLVMRLLTENLGVQGFGIYALSRKVISIAIPIATLMMSLSIARYVATCKDDLERKGYLLAGFVICVIPALVMLGVGMAYSERIAEMLFYSREHASIVKSLVAFLCGYIIYTVLYAYYRGSGKIYKANIWQLIIVAGWPLFVVMLWGKGSDTSVIIRLFAIMYYVALLPLLVLLAAPMRAALSDVKMAFQRIKDLLAYGLQRIPAGFALVGMMAVGPFLASRYCTIEDVGYLVVGQSVYRVVEAALTAFGLVVLPKAAQLVAENQHTYLGERIGDIISMIFHVGLFVTLQLIIWAEDIVVFWLGQDYLPAVPLMRILLISIIPYIAYVLLRAIVDAVEKKAVNTVNLIIALVIATIAALIFIKLGMGPLGIALATMIGYIALGISTVIFLWKSYSIRFKSLMYVRCVLLNAMFVSLALVCGGLIKSSMSGIAGGFVTVVMVTAFFLVYLLLLRRGNAMWINMLESRLRSVRVSV